MTLAALLTNPVVLFLAIISAVVYFWLLSERNGRKEPPGPWGLPIVGYMPFMDRRMNLTLTKLADRYGDVYKVQIGTRKIVVINGNATIKEALVPGKSDFSGRPDFFTYQAADKSFGFCDWGAKYRALKKIGVKGLGMFANARNKNLEEVAQKAAQDFIEECKRQKNRPFNPKETLYDNSACIMGFICYGRQFERDDPELRTILNTADEVGTTIVTGILVDFIPSLGFLMKEKMNRFLTVMGKVRSYSSALVAKVMEDAHADEKPLTVAHAISKAVTEMDEDEKKVLHIDNEYIKGLVGSLFGAGFGTIAITIRWALLLSAKHPKIQERLFKELDSVVGGKEAYPKFSDSSRLPYFNAFVTELYRFSSIASVAVTHRCTQDTTFHGYFIKKDTPVIINLYSAHYDTRVFPDPFVFKPERFLDPNTGEFNAKAAEYVMPYGQGHRRCGGEALGRLELFMFLATIFQRCKVEEAPGEPLDPNNYMFTWALDPKPFNVVLRSRYGGW